MDSINQVVENKEYARLAQANGVKVYPCAEILGSMEKVKDFGYFFVKHRQELEVIEKSNLLDYASTQTFTPQEFKAYRMGLETMRSFFEAAEQDMSAYILEAERQNKLS